MTERQPSLSGRRPIGYVPKSALLSGIFVAVGVQLALCGVLIALHYQEVIPVPSEPAQTVALSFVKMDSEKEEVSEEVEEMTEPEELPPPVVPAPMITPQDEIFGLVPLMSDVKAEVPDVALSMVDSEVPSDEIDGPGLSINMREPVRQKRPRKRPNAAPQGALSVQEETPDKKVRYRNAPSLPGSVNASKVGVVNAVVKVRVTVSVQGEPTEVVMVQSTGNDQLDRIFLRWVKENWSFYPAEKNGKPMVSKVVVPVRLRID